MAKTTTSQKSKNDVVGKAKGASNEAPIAEKKPATKNTKVEAPDNTTGDQKDNGLPFTADADGMIEVYAKDRAGTSVYGATGEVITFDEKGCAKVCMEEALHFLKMPGFEFKE